MEANQEYFVNHEDFYLDEIRYIRGKSDDVWFTGEEMLALAEFKTKIHLESGTHEDCQICVYGGIQ